MKRISKKRQEIIKAAYEWLGTPYQHQAMVKGPNGAVDCAMLVTGVALDAGLVTREDTLKIPNYSRDGRIEDGKHVLLSVMESFGCTEKDNKYRHPGDIVVFQLGPTLLHIGILIEDNHMIHAYGSRSVGYVAKNELINPWSNRLIKTYKFPGIK